MNGTDDPTNSERRRFLLQQIQHHYRQIIEHVGKAPGDIIEIPEVTLPPLRGKFKYFTLEKLYRDANYGLAYLLLSRMSAEHMEILLTALNGIQVPGE